jgi:exosortase D (VPLPA-CTERM-specific)
MGAFFVGLLGIPVYLEGNVLDLGTYKLAVVEACSGLRYLFPLLSLGFLAAYLFRAPLWQRVLVFLCTIPITILMNSLRIAFTAWTMNHWGQKMADEVLHAFEGWLIFMACAALLALVMLALARCSGTRLREVFDVPAVAVPQGKEAVHAGRRAALAACLMCLCIAALTTAFISTRTEIIPERQRFALFPKTIGAWQGRASGLDIETQRGLGLDDYVLSDFNSPGERPINLYVAYYASQRSGVSTHSPSVCIPGGGWLITRLEQVSHSIDGAEMPINRIVIERDSHKQLVYYWFSERGRLVANEYLAKAYLLADAITMNRTDGAMVRLTTRLFPGETEQSADLRLQSFRRLAVPSLNAYLPVREAASRRPALSNTASSAPSS